MGVLHGHRQAGVTEDLLKRRERATAHHVPGGEVVSEIVEVEVLDLGGLDGVLEWVRMLPAGQTLPTCRPGSWLRT